MARIDYCDTSKSSERTREILDKNRNANIFRMMAHSPSYFEQYCRLGGAIRHRGELDPVVRELAITRTGILCEAPYEIAAHKRIGKNVGVTDEQNAALEDWKSATCFDESPLSEYRRCQGRTVMRRHFDSHVTRLANGRGKTRPKLVHVTRRCRFCETIQAVDPLDGAGYCFRRNLLNDKNNPRPRSQTPKVETWPASTIAILRNRMTAPAKYWEKTATPIFSG